jgi:hypothetical protein
MDRQLNFARQLNALGQIGQQRFDMDLPGVGVTPSLLPRSIIISKIRDRLGLPKDFVLHSFRHFDVDPTRGSGS